MRKRERDGQTSEVRGEKRSGEQDRMHVVDGTQHPACDTSHRVPLLTLLVRLLLSSMGSTTFMNLGTNVFFIPGRLPRGVRGTLPASPPALLSLALPSADPSFTPASASEEASSLPVVVRLRVSAATEKRSTQLRRKASSRRGSPGARPAERHNAWATHITALNCIQLEMSAEAFSTATFCTASFCGPSVTLNHQSSSALITGSVASEQRGRHNSTALSLLWPRGH